MGPSLGTARVTVIDRGTPPPPGQPQWWKIHDIVTVGTGLTLELAGNIFRFEVSIAPCDAEKLDCMELILDAIAFGLECPHHAAPCDLTHLSSPSRSSVLFFFAGFSCFFIIIVGNKARFGASKV
jgi:hypothetical protein